MDYTTELSWLFWPSVGIDIYAFIYTILKVNWFSYINEARLLITDRAKIRKHFLK
jgi:hypothetical protein